MSNHTSGPWRAFKHHGRKSLQVFGPMDELICELHYHSKTDNNNTSLLVAAPDLLEVLEALAYAIMDRKGAWKDSKLMDIHSDALLALSKARGSFAKYSEGLK